MIYYIHTRIEYTDKQTLNHEQNIVIRTSNIQIFNM